MTKNCSVFYVPKKNRLVLQCSHENSSTGVMADPTCRLSALTDAVTLGKFVVMIANESIKPWPAISGDDFKEITSSTTKLVGFGSWGALEIEAELCQIVIRGENAQVERWVSAKKTGTGRGYEPSRNPEHIVTCSNEHGEIGKTILSILEIAQ